MAHSNVIPSGPAAWSWNCSPSSRSMACRFWPDRQKPRRQQAFPSQEICCARRQVANSDVLGWNFPTKKVRPSSSQRKRLAFAPPFESVEHAARAEPGHVLAEQGEFAGAAWQASPRSPKRFHIAVAVSGKPDRRIRARGDRASVQAGNSPEFATSGRAVHN